MKTKSPRSSANSTDFISCRKAAWMVCISLFSIYTGNAQSDHRDCCIPAFGSITLYHSYQPGSVIGFGMEAGKWNKEASRFSYFLGTKLQWIENSESSAKSGEESKYNSRFSLYMKGQFRIIDRLYLVVSPTFVNLSSFETGAGLRYVLPISRVIGIGLEPTYSLVEKQFSINTNIHFALEN
jgi:hypothetical protein